MFDSNFMRKKERKGSEIYCKWRHKVQYTTNDEITTKLIKPINETTINWKRLQKHQNINENVQR